MVTNCRQTVLRPEECIAGHMPIVSRQVLKGRNEPQNMASFSVACTFRTCIFHPPSMSQYSTIQPPSRRTATTCHAAKEIIFNETGEALKRMQAGVDKLAPKHGRGERSFNHFLSADIPSFFADQCQCQPPVWASTIPPVRCATPQSSMEISLKGEIPPVPSQKSCQNRLSKPHHSPVLANVLRWCHVGTKRA